LRPFDASGAFQPTVDSRNLQSLAVRGAGATVFFSGLGLVVHIVTTMVLGRLLTPRDFGVVTMVTTFSLLLINFGGNGFTEAIVQREHIDHFLVSNLFWINLGAGVLLTALFAAAGSVLARFYGNPLVAHVAIGISLTILVTSTAVQHQALLKRAMRFSAISSNELLARVVSVTVSIVLAWAGWGYWALVAGAVALPLSQAVGAWTLCRWIPGLPRRIEGTAEMTRFALNIYGRFSVNYFARNADNLLVGWRFNAQSLGFYKKAYDLFALPGSQLVAPLTTVAVSALSRLDRKSSEYRRALLAALSTTAFVGMGLGAALTLTGKDVIRLLLGPGWEQAGQIFTLFGPGVGIMLLYNTHCWIHLSIGTPARWLRWVFVEFTLTGLLFVVGLRYGPAGVAAAWTASFWILTIPAFWYAGKPIGLRVTLVTDAVWRYVVASVASGGATALILERFLNLSTLSGSPGAAARIVVTAILFSILYLAAVSGLHLSFSPVGQFARLAREMIPFRCFAKSAPAYKSTRGTGERNVVLKTQQAGPET
jgi:O-antigen/teichoic acid export membrane protein